MFTNLKKVKKEYEKSCNEYVKIFCKKNEIDFDYWIGNEIGGCASFCEQYYFNLSDIIYDVNNHCKKGLILEWQDDSTENSERGNINYSSYSKGLRYKDLK